MCAKSQKRKAFFLEMAKTIALEKRSNFLGIFFSVDTRSTTFKYVGNRVKSILKHRQPYLCAQKAKKEKPFFWKWLRL